MYPEWLHATTCVAVGRGPAAASRSSTLTPANEVPSLLHVVTQWMSPAYVEPGSRWICSQVHSCADSTRPSTRRLQVARSRRGLTSAVSTGNVDPVSYCPGGSRGSRSVADAGRRNGLAMVLSMPSAQS